MQNQKIFELYKPKYDIWKNDDINQNMQTKICKNFYTKETTCKAVTTDFLSKISNKSKISKEDFNICKLETS